MLTFLKLLLHFLIFPALVMRQARRSRQFSQLKADAKKDRDRVVLKPGIEPDHCWTSTLPSDRSYELWLDGIRVAPSDLVAVHLWEHATSTMASGFEEDAVYRFTVRSAESQSRIQGVQTREVVFLLSSADRTIWPILQAIPKDTVRTSQSLGHTYGVGLLLLIPWAALASVLTIAAIVWFGHKGRW